MMTLNYVEPGKEVSLVSISGGRGIISKLSSMGLVPGVKITVLSRNGHGPVMISNKESRLAIGNGMARKISVV